MVSKKKSNNIERAKKILRDSDCEPPKKKLHKPNTNTLHTWSSLVFFVYWFRVVHLLWLFLCLLLFTNTLFLQTIKCWCSIFTTCYLFLWGKKCFFISQLNSLSFDLKCERKNVACLLPREARISHSKWERESGRERGAMYRMTLMSSSSKNYVIFTRPPLFVFTAHNQHN